MFRTTLLLIVVLLAVDVGSSFAQRRTGATTVAAPDHKVELNLFGGYAWTFARRVCGIQCGDIDIKDSGFWGVALDVNVQPFTQLELLYNRQDTKLTFNPDFAAKRDIGDLAVEYYHIGGLRGVPRGKLMPFGSFTLGATRFHPKNSSLSDEWKFSMILGLGAKVYAGKRLGFRFQGRLPYTFTSGSVGLGCGGGGCGAFVGGYGIGQIDVSAGAFLMF